MSSKITAHLGLDVSAFQSGLDKANGAAQRFKNILKTGDVGGGLKQMVGAGAIIMAFRGIMNAAQDARTEAKALGMEMDKGAASVAAYADRWDQIKDSIKDAGIAALGFFTQTGRAIGNKLGTGSSDAEVSAIETNKKDQTGREADLKANGERINREIAATQKELDAARRNNAVAGLTDKEKERAIEKEIYELGVSRSKMLPNSLAYKKNELEAEKRMAELRDVSERIKGTKKPLASDLIDRADGGLTLAEAAKMRPMGRRSERERIAADALSLEERGKRAASAGQFGLAKSLMARSVARARGIGFGGAEGEVGDIRRDGDSGPKTMDQMIAARNSALTARYGGSYVRPESFQNARPVEQSADALLKEAAESLKTAADELKNAMSVEATDD